MPRCSLGQTVWQTTINLAFTQLGATDELTIEGLGTDKTVIDANFLSRILDLGSVDQTFRVTLSGLWFREGKTTASGEDGGAIRKLSLGTLAIDRCQITDSSVGGADSRGGGILAVGDLTLTNSTVSDNTATIYGGGIASLGALTVINSTISSNSAPVLVRSFTTTIGGGGVFLGPAASLLLVATTVTANVGVGVVFASPNSSITIVSSIVASNSGPDLFEVGSTTWKPHNDFCISSQEQLGPLRKVNVVASYSLVGNHEGTSLLPGAPDPSGNLIGSGNAYLDPKLGPLTNNGGPTRTHALLPGSLAVNAGVNPSGLQFDQRGAGFVREYGAQADIGAYEVQPQIFVVGIIEDEDDGNYAAGDLSLREAIKLSNGSAGSDTIAFASGLSGLIMLTGGELNLGGGGPLTINGPGAAQLTVSGNKASRVFNVFDSSDSLVIRGLTIADGNANGTARGGAILSRANLTIADCVIRGSSSSGDGGGIYHYAFGTLAIIGSTLRDNSATLNGGGLHVANATLAMANSTMSGNTSGFIGGAIMLDISVAKVTAATISGNSSGSGGGVFNNLSNLTLESSVLAGNTSGAEGGPDLLHGLGASLSTAHSLIGTNDGNPLVAAPLGAPDALGNLIGTPAVRIDPKLGSLAYNGGPTQTRALLAGSPAINMGSNSLGLAFDQRGTGFLRVAGGTADMGAFELSIPSPLAGDANRDRKVDLTDFGLLKLNFGVGTLWEQGDFDANAKVDLSDFGVLKLNFGKTGQAANAAATDEFYARLGLALAKPT